MPSDLANEPTPCPLAIPLNTVVDISETVYQSRTENTLAKRKSTKGQTTIDTTYL
jgi:BRCT domain type II-containing protein